MKTETIRSVACHAHVGAATLLQMSNNTSSLSKVAWNLGLAIPHYLSIIVCDDIALADYGQ